LTPTKTPTRTLTPTITATPVCRTDGDLIIVDGQTCTLNAGSYTFDSIVVHSGGALNLASYDNGDTNYTNDSGITVEVDTLTIDEGGHISADGLGYAAVSTAAGHGPGGGETLNGSARGGGYGSLGGNARTLA